MSDADDERLPRAARLPARALAVLPRASSPAATLGGLADIARAAADREAGAARDGHAGEPVRRAPVRRAERDRAHLLDQRHDRHAELHPADRVGPRQLGRRARRAATPPPASQAGERIVSTYNAGPFAAGAALAAFERIGLVPHPGRHRQHRAAGAGDRAAAARGRRADARRTPRTRSSGRPSAASTCRLERRARARRRRARRRRAGLPRDARGGLGRARDRGDGDRRHRRLAVGRVRAAGRHAPRRARLRPPRADRPRDRRRARRWRTARPASSCSPTCATAPRRCCASARATTSRSGATPCPCGRTGPRIRCIGRTDDMLIVRGVNVFPSAVREVVSGFAPEVSGHILVRPPRAGRQAGPAAAGARRARARRGRRTPRSPTRSASGCATCSSCRRTSSSCRGGALQRSEYKSKLVERLGGMRKLQSQGVHHITIVGADRQTSIDFWEGVLGMPFVFEQPNLDNASESHLYFDPGDGRLITIFTNEEPRARPRRARRPTRAACTTSRSRSRRRRSPRRSSASTSAASATAASRTAGSWTRSTSRTRSAC